MPRFLSLALALPLVACGGASEPQPPAPAPAASPTPVADTRTAPRPSPLRSFGDWAVGCDNGATCQAGSLMPEEGDPPAVSLSIERAAGPGGTVTIRLYRAEITLPLTASVDGTAVARGGVVREDATELTGAPALELAKQIARGQALTIADAAGATVATLPLTGAAAALRWIDAQQGRDGTTGAIVARGDRPDTRPAPAPPVVRTTPIRGEAALLDPLLVEKMRSGLDCDGDALPDVTARPLGDGRTLAIVPCTAGAYNLLSALFVVERGAATPVQFDAPLDSGGASEEPLLFNATFGDDGVLTTLAKGRGLGDCGVTQRYAWDGTRFRLIEQRAMDECRGNTDFIRTWTARVVR